MAPIARSRLFILQDLQTPVFPNCTIMEAIESSRGSYAWKSILHGRDVIKRGACWRIGNGKKVQIWQHTWLPLKHPTRVQSPMLEGWEETTVDVLINEDSQTWNEHLIAGLFVPEEAELIKKIPLSRHPTEDKLFWPWTQSGKYSCKSRFRFLKMEEEEGGNENEEETTLHALWSCRELNSVWSQTKWSSRQTSSVTNFKELLSWILNNHGNQELFAMVTWGVWHQRNQVQNHRPCYTLDQLTSQAKEKLAEFVAVLPPITPATPKPKEKWKPPDASLVKINFD
ncbi:hypothetical protein SO802_010489 [Lithocarpus litseifolius]|uniref:Reverse transcriptase zinc-binding domain-containing protein n=1 Tax=Lithocarpus litseifolius TaxID=425828 RepID=A0AAW2DGL6_9ROSI